MKRHLPTLITALLLAACIAGYFLTSGSGNPERKHNASAGPSNLADDLLLQTAMQMASLADSNDEQSPAKEALRLADNDLDQAAASALREAAAPGPPPTGKVKQAADRVAAIRGKIGKSRERIQKLTKLAATGDEAADQLELAKAQLALDEDELENAREILIRLGGDRRAKLERAMKLHQHAQQHFQMPKIGTEGMPASLFGMASMWLSLGGRESTIDSARRQAVDRAAALEREHGTLEALIDKTATPKTASRASAGDDEDTETMVARLRQLSDGRKSQADLGKRIQDIQQLSEVYKKWGGVLEQRRRTLAHLAVRSMTIILAIAMAGILSVRIGRRAFDRREGARRLHQIRVISTVSVQIVCGLLIVLVIFGPPSQTSTLIGLATAGLTVVLKDFIVAFFGWFVLIGRNGIHIGDWVEIEGVGGEVIEIGLIKTVLLEMGTWSGSGHPTGRRVSFNNKFAIEQHYFNFSTTSRWRWDELEVTLPLGINPYKKAQEIRRRVEDLTADDAALAEQDWQRVTRQYGTQEFSAKPSMDLKPSVNGLDVSVRYITRAPKRSEMKSKLFAAIVDLLHGPDEDAEKPA